jgi:hypothetical protein
MRGPQLGIRGSHFRPFCFRQRTRPLLFRVFGEHLIRQSGAQRTWCYCVHVSVVGLAFFRECFGRADQRGLGRCVRRGTCMGLIAPPPEILMILPECRGFMIRTACWHNRSVPVTLICHACSQSGIATSSVGPIGPQMPTQTSAPVETGS